jgi:hypothetical protein
MNLGERVQVVVERMQAPHYRVSVRTGAREAFARELEITPGRADYAFGAIRDMGVAAPEIELYLPDDPIAGMNWERVSRGLIRCTPRDYSFRRPRLSGPVRIGVICSPRTDRRLVSEVQEAIERALPSKEGFEVSVLQPSDWTALRREMRNYNFESLHILMESEMAGQEPQAVFGGDKIPMNNMVAEVARPGRRSVVLHDVTERPDAMTALRRGAQHLPARCETSMMLFSDVGSRQFLGEMGGYYKSFLEDKPLTECMGHFAAQHERGNVCVMTHEGTVRGLGAVEDRVFTRNYTEQVFADLGKLQEHRLAIGGVLPAPEKKQGVANSGASAFFSLNYDPLELKDFGRWGNIAVTLTTPAAVEPQVKQAKDIIQDALKKISEGDHEQQPRYPAAWFYHVDATSETAIPDTQSLTWPPPVGVGLEFQFWLDVVRTGITSITETPAIVKPDNVVYPLTLKVRTWSEDFHFASTEAEIVLQATGATNRAKFPVTKLKEAPRRAELFVFVEHQTTLIAAFRVEADVTEDPDRHEGAQNIEHAYLASDWFQFSEAPQASALTIFITKKHGELRLFTLKPNGNPWETLGPNENGLYEKNKEIYKEVQSLARRAEQAAKGDGEFVFANEAGRLAKLGHPLFSDIFLQSETGGAGVFADEYVRTLKEGSLLTIAIGREAQGLYVPWGLLYDRQPPYEYFDAPKLQGFLGYRYNLVVRPSTPLGGRPPRGQLPIRLGAAWLEHEETARLRESYEPLEKDGSLKIEPIKSEEHRLPALAKNQYDLVEFFCHGHTKLSGVFSPNEVAELLNSYAGASAKGKQDELLMAIDMAGDSLLDLSGGFVTLASLADSLKEPMPGNPIVLLSMCESAQVSASGTGFVPFFLRRGARAVIGTEGPTLWWLSRKMDTEIVTRLIHGETIGQAFYETRKKLVTENMLALIYTLYGAADAKLVAAPNAKERSETGAK